MLWHLDLISDTPGLLHPDLLPELLLFSGRLVTYLHYNPPPIRGKYSRSCGQRRPGLSLIYDGWVSLRLKVIIIYSVLVA